MISGQLAAAVAIDRFGLFGISKQPIGVASPGLVLLIVGALLVVRK